MEKPMKNFGRAVALAAALASVLAVLSSAACAPSGAAAVTPAPEAAAATAAAPTATPSPTPTPSPEPTPRIDEYGFSEERKAELQVQFQAFLNKEGEFTPEKISSIMIKTISSLAESKIGLGMVDGQKIEGYFFDYFEKYNRIFLLMGFDGSDGNRFITPIEIPLYMFEGIKTSIFSVYRMDDNSILFSNGESFDYSDRNDLLPFLDSIKGKIIAFVPFTDKINESDASSFGDVAVDYVKNEHNPKTGLSFGLYQLVISNGFEIPESTESDGSSILKINNFEDVNVIDISKVPLIGLIIYLK